MLELEMAKASWRELPPNALVLEAGNSVEYLTSTWAPTTCVFYKEYCTDCMFCWFACPDNAIVTKDGRMAGIDWDFCKSCGLCVVACPTKPKSLEIVDKAVAEELEQAHSGGDPSPKHFQGLQTARGQGTAEGEPAATGSTDPEAAHQGAPAV